MLIHAGQTNNKRLKCGSRISIPQCLELLGGHAGYSSEVFKRFTACGSGNLHFYQCLGESRTAHFSFNAYRRKCRGKAQNLCFRQADLRTCSGKTHGHHHNGRFGRGEVITQLNQSRTEVAEQTLIHAGDICELSQRGCGFGSNDIRTVAQVDHCPGEFGQVIRTDAQLTGDSDNLCDVIGGSGNFRGHTLDLIREGSELFLSRIDRLADRGESGFIRNGRLDRR